MEIQIFNFTGYEDECEVSYFDGERKYLKTLFLTNLDLTLYYDKKRDTHRVTINSVNATQYDKKDEGKAYLLDDFEIFEIEQEMAQYIDWCEWEENQKYDDDFLD